MGASLRRGRLRRRVWLVRRPASRPAHAPRAAPGRRAARRQRARDARPLAGAAPRCCSARRTRRAREARRRRDGRRRARDGRALRGAGSRAARAARGRRGRACALAIADYGTPGSSARAHAAAAARRAEPSRRARRARCTRRRARHGGRARSSPRGRRASPPTTAAAPRRGGAAAWSLAVDAPIGARADGDFRMAVARPARGPRARSCASSPRPLPRTARDRARASPQRRRHQLRVHMRALGHLLVGDATDDGEGRPRARRGSCCTRALRLPPATAARRRVRPSPSRSTRGPPARGAVPLARRASRTRRRRAGLAAAVLSRTRFGRVLEAPGPASSSVPTPARALTRNALLGSSSPPPRRCLSGTRSRRRQGCSSRRSPRARRYHRRPRRRRLHPRSRRRRP